MQRIDYNSDTDPRVLAASERADRIITDIRANDWGDAELHSEIATAIIDVHVQYAAQLAEAEKRAAQWQATAEDLNQRNHQAWMLVGAFQWSAEVAVKDLAAYVPRAAWARESRKLLASALEQAKAALKL